MSDKPLFQNADAQERAYAPQELPVGTAGERRAVDEEGDPSAASAGVIVPGAAIGPGGLGAVTGATGSTGGAPAIGAAIAGASLSEDEDRDDDGVVETGERR